jgi:hypothetical protein
LLEKGGPVELGDVEGPQPNELANQTTKPGKKILAKRADDLAANDIAGNVSDIKPRAESKLAELAPKIATEREALDAKGARPDVDKINSKLDDIINAHKVNGVAIDDSVVNRVESIKSKLADVTKDGKISYSSIDDIRRLLDSQVNFLTDPKATTKAIKSASNAFRSVLAETDGAEAINRLKSEYSLWSDVRELASRAKPNGPIKPSSAVETPTTKKMAVPGRLTVHAASGVIGGVAAHFLGIPIAGDVIVTGATSAASAAVEAAIRSGAVRRAPIQIRNSIADAIASGNFVHAAKLSAMVYRSGQFGASNSW